jgi:hypothetical protein
MKEIKAAAVRSGSRFFMQNTDRAIKGARHALLKNTGRLFHEFTFFLSKTSEILRDLLQGLL